MNIVRALIDKVHAIRQKSANKTEFKARLMEAVADGRLTPEEMQHLQTLQQQLELTPEDFAAFRVSAYLTAFSAAKADGIITADEEHELSSIKGFLGVADAEIAATIQELGRFRLLREIHEGNIPVISVAGLVLQKGESAYWKEEASILEEKVLDRSYVGGSQGVSLRITRGVSYRVGAQRGHLVSQTGVVPVSQGDLVITSKRIMFLGNKKGFNIRLDKLLNVELHRDGVTVTDGNGKPHAVQFTNSDNADVVGAVLSHAVNHFVA